MNPTTHETEGNAAAPGADLAALAGRGGEGEGALQVELTRFRGWFGAWVTSGYPQAARGAGDRGKCREM